MCRGAHLSVEVGICETGGQSGLHNEFEDNQSYREAPSQRGKKQIK